MEFHLLFFFLWHSYIYAKLCAEYMQVHHPPTLYYTTTRKTIHTILGFVENFKYPNFNNAIISW